MNKYNKGYYIEYYDSHYKEYNHTRLVYRKLASEWKMSVLKSLISEDIKPKIVLEVGCGLGDNLKIMTDYWGAEFIGIDISSQAISHAKQKMPTGNFHVMDIDEYHRKNGTISDLVFLVDILEHLESPVEFIKQARNLGTHFLMKIPLEKGLLRNLPSKTRGKEIVGLECNPAGHLFLWNLSDAFKLLENGGMRIINWVTEDPPESLRYYYPNPKKRGIKKLLGLMLTCMEKGTCKKAHNLHRILFGSSLFVLCEKDIKIKDTI